MTKILGNKDTNFPGAATINHGFLHVSFAPHKTDIHPSVATHLSSKTAAGNLLRDKSWIILSGTSLCYFVSLQQKSPATTINSFLITNGIIMTTKSVIITGSSSGIGLGIARHFAANGMNVMLNGIESPEEVAPVLAEFANSAGKIAYNPANMLEPEQIEALYADAVAQFGQVDIIINNAGIQHVAPVEEFPASKWEAIIGINLSSAFHLTRMAVAGMKARNWGRVINIASAHGLVASPYKSAYVAAKHGIVGLTKTVALETAQHGVTVNAICPGYVRTPLVEKQIPDTAKARGITEEEVIRDVLLAAQPTKQFVTTEQLAELALFLCSDAAAAITGAALPVDGGWVAQ
ncbi:MAG: 3-hydroxybutyrate dehydrogenase [Thiolinea sp.]